MDWSERMVFMKRSISLTFSLGGATALALVTTPLLPATAQNTDSAEDLGLGIQKDGGDDDEDI